MAAAVEKSIAEIRASKPLAKHADRILELVRPHIRFKLRKGKPADMNLGVSRLGGDPDLPAGIAWPMGYDGDAPMDFIAQIDLDTVAKRDVDGVLPKSGVLAFFVSQDYDECAVIQGEHDALVRVPTPGPKKKKKGAPPPKWGGIDVTADMVLPPPWTQFVSSKKRSASAWNPRTDKTGKGKTLVELPADAHEAYCEIYDRWIGEVGYKQDGMLGYERKMEGVQEPDELALLRIDYNELSYYDFVEAVTIYWFITADDLVARKFDDVEVYVGSTI
jgi:uncharacterized protein YwqG